MTVADEILDFTYKMLNYYDKIKLASSLKTSTFHPVKFLNFDNGWRSPYISTYLWYIAKHTDYSLPYCNIPEYNSDYPLYVTTPSMDGYLSEVYNNLDIYVVPAYPVYYNGVKDTFQKTDTPSTRYIKYQAEAFVAGPTPYPVASAEAVQLLIACGMTLHPSVIPYLENVFNELRMEEPYSYIKKTYISDLIIKLRDKCLVGSDTKISNVIPTNMWNKEF